MSKKSEKIRVEIQNRYKDQHKKSQTFFQIQQTVFPGGMPRNVQYHKPFPFVIERGEGSKVFDLDGNQYVDFCNNMSSLILGHSHPKVLGAVQKQIIKGIVHSNPTPIQFELADLLCRRVPSIEQIRFLNSGTEAGMWAVRLARAFTGKEKIMKMEGGYHGLYDGVDISIHPSLEKAGNAARPKSVPDDEGILSSTAKNTIVVPFNDKEATKVIFNEHAENLAAVIVEPMLGTSGMIPSQEGYLEFLRELTSQNNVLLIFDEVITLRFSSGGAQEYFGIKPDLTMLGKIMGGGFPVGAFGGRRDIMALVSPLAQRVSHSGTFSANSATMAAGLVTMRELTPECICKMNDQGEYVRREANRALNKYGVRGQVTGMCSSFAIHFTTEPIRNYREIAKAKDDILIPSLLNLCLLNRGFYLTRKASGYLSTVISDGEVGAFVNAFDESLREIYPVIEEETPELIIQ